MNTANYFKSLNLELNALKDRVRQFDCDHWLTDGEWKESVLRTILRRHLPSDVRVGRGFVVKRHSCSSQIDVLIFDGSAPILFQDGDLVFVTTEAVKGIIEVKTSVRKSDLLNIAEKLADNSEFVGRKRDGHQDVFIGLFSYDSECSSNQGKNVLEDIAQAVGWETDRVINHAAIGSSIFIRFWHKNPLDVDNTDYNTWHCYELTDMAAGYFISNVIGTVSRSGVQSRLCFPDESKEVRKIHSQSMSRGL